MTYYPDHPYYDISDTGGLPRKTGTLIAKELPEDGFRSWKVTTQPTVEPVTVAELKTFARIDTNEEDSLISSFIVAARMSAEEYLGQAFISQTITTFLEFWPGRMVELPRPPLISVTGVYTIDEDDAETEYDSDNYYLNTIATPGQLCLKRGSTQPINTDRDFGRFIIRSVHGYGTAASDVPSQFVEGIKLWAAALYSDRTIDTKNPPPDARKMFDLFKRPEMVIR